MSKGKYLFITMVLLAMGSLASGVSANVQPCGGASNKTGKTYKINGTGIAVRSGPGTSYEKRINQKATSILKTTRYIEIDNSVTVYEECSQDGWSKIRVTEPDYLSQSHRGWVSSKVLRGKKLDSSGAEIFTEADFYFDKKTKPYKSIIIAGVNKVYRENSRCKEIDPSSAYISSSKGTPSNPVFYVTCGGGTSVFNAFFSKLDVEADSKLTAKKHIDKSLAINQCENYAKSSAAYPSTVDFSKFMDLAVTEHSNGNTTVMSSFTAKNGFNLELKYNIRCISNASGLFEANISEAE